MVCHNTVSILNTQECGPRFTLKLLSLQHGTFDTKGGEYEWVHKVVRLSINLFQYIDFMFFILRKYSIISLTHSWMYIFPLLI